MEYFWNSHSFDTFPVMRPRGVRFMLSTGAIWATRDMAEFRDIGAESLSSVA